MKPRIVYVHGNQSSHWSFGWSSWLKKELEKLAFRTFFETFPDSVIARSKYWLPFLKNYVKAGKNDVIVGWSSGAVAAMRYAETNKIRGSVLISPYRDDLGDPLEKQSGYFNKAWKWKNIRNNQNKIALIYGENDPYIPQEQFHYIATKLSPTIFRVPKGKHFIDYKKFPLLLKYLKENYLTDK